MLIVLPSIVHGMNEIKIDLQIDRHDKEDFFPVFPILPYLVESKNFPPPKSNTFN